MKHLKLFFACLLMAILGFGQVWATDPVASQSPSDGKSYVVAAYVNSKYYALPNGAVNGATINGVEVSLNTAGKVSTDDASGKTWTLTEGTTSGQFYLSYTSGDDTYYLYKNGTGKTNYNFKVSTSNQNYWAFTANGTGYTVAAVDRGTNNVNVNNSNGTFSCRADATPIILLPIGDASSCTKTVTVSKVTPVVNGDFALSATEVCGDGEGGEVSVTNIQPAAGYELDEISATVGTVSGTTVTGITSNTSITVTFKALPKYTVSFSTGEGNPEVAAVTEASYGAGVTLPNGPTPTCSTDNWEFAGWAAEAVGTQTTDAPTFLTGTYHPTENTTLFAVYKKVVSGDVEELDKTEGFETKDAGTNYQETVTVNASQSDCGIGWSIYYGTVSTNDKITGSKSAQMRWYSSANTTYGYVESTTPISGLQKVTFNARVSNTDVKFDFYYSTDGENWTLVKDDYVCSETGKGEPFEAEINGTVGTDYYIFIGVSDKGKAPSSGNYKLIIDDVKFEYQTGSSTTYYLSAPTCTTPTCEKLGTPVVSVPEATLNYNSAKLTWDAVENADKYLVKFNGVDQAATANEYFEATGLNPTTQYTYQVKALAADGQEDWCDGVFSTEANFTTKAEPVYTVKFSTGAGNSIQADIAEDVRGEGITLPAAPATIKCASDDWSFAGWAEAEVASKTDETPTLKAAGTTFVPSSDNQTLYAVYSKVEESGSSVMKYVQVTELAQVNAGGEFIITNGDKYLPSAASSTSVSQADMVSVEAGVVTGTIVDAMKWNISVADGEGYVTVTNANGDYLYVASGSNNGLRVGATQDSWKFEEYTVDEVLGFAMQEKNYSRWCAVYTSGIDWRTYTAKDATNYGNNDGRLDLYKKTEVPVATTYYWSAPECCLVKPVNNIAVSAVGETSVTLTWEAPTSLGGIDKLQIVNAANDEVVVDNIAKDALTGTVTGLTECTEYSFYVASYSEECTAKTDPVAGTPYGGAKVVTFNYDGGTGSVASASTSCGVDQVTLATPDAREGYNFKGWYDGETLIGLAGASYTPSASITLKAHWAQLYTVHYDFAGATTGVAPDDAQYEAGAEVSLTNVVPTKGYLAPFKAWEYSVAVTVTGGKFAMPASDLTITATYDEIVGRWIKVSGETTLTEGTMIVIAAVSSNYALSTTQNNNNRGEVYVTKGDKTITLNDNVQIFTLEASTNTEGNWALKCLNGETAGQYIYAASGSSNHLKSRGENSDGNSEWAIDVAGGKATAQGTNARKYLRYNSSSSCFSCYGGPTDQGAIEFYYFQEGLFYDVTYAKGISATVNNMPTDQVTNPDGTVVLSDKVPTTNGKVFDGWKDADENTYAAGQAITTPLSDNLALTAQWRDPVNYTVSYNANGGTLKPGKSPIADASVAEAASYEIAKNVYEKDGFNFVGWEYAGNIYAEEENFTMPSNNVEFVAHWAALTATDFMLVTDVKQLKEGDKVYIAAAGYLTAMSTQNGSSYREKVDVYKSADKKRILLQEGATAPVEFTVGKVGDLFTFNDGTGYLYANSTSSNNIGTQTTLSDAGKWTITIDAEGNTAIYVDGASRGVMQYNNSQPRFTCYASATMRPVVLYKRPDYSREVSANFATICLPKEGKIDGAALFKIAYYGEESKKIFFDEILSGVLEAGKPYLFLPNEGVSKIGVYYGDNTAADVAAGSENGLYGFYDLDDDEAIYNIPEDGTCYIMYANQYWQVVPGRGAYIANNRAYIRLSDINPSMPALAPGCRRVSMNVNGEQVATSLDALNASETPVKMIIDGQLFIIRGEKMYNANGQLVK